MRDIRPNPRKRPPNVPPPQDAPPPSRPASKPAPRFSGAKVPIANVPVQKSPPPAKPPKPHMTPPGPAPAPTPLLHTAGQYARTTAGKIKGTLAPFARTGVSGEEVSKLRGKHPIKEKRAPALKMPWSSKGTNKAAKPAVPLARQPEAKPELSPSKQKRTPSPKPAARLGGRERLIIVMLFLLVIIIGGLAVYIFLPKADITLVLRTAPLLVDETVTIQAEGANDPGTIPGTSFFREVELTGAAPVTSTEFVGAKASGTVVLINRTFDEQDIKEQSRLVTEDGQLFYMQRAATIPPAEGSALGSTTVPVEAAEAGPNGNISEGHLNFAALDESSQTLVYAEVREPLTGGAGDLTSVVQEADLAAANDAAGEQARAQVEQDIRAELPDGWVILDESWVAEIADFATTAKSGEHLDTIPYSARATVRVIGYEADALEDFLRSELETRVDQEFMLFPGPIAFTKTVESVDWDQGSAIIAARVTHATIPDLSLETLKQKLSGRSEEEATQYLEGLPGVRGVSLKLWPFWATGIPRIDSRIYLDFQSEQGTSP